MADFFFQLLGFADEYLWDFVGIPALLLLGLFLSLQSGFFQLTHLKKIIQLFFSFFGTTHETNTRGIHPLKAFFASLGGCMGIGNIVVVCTAVQIGGPGAVFWMWVAAFLGMIVKYAEIYLGVKYRVKNQFNSYDGGPMYFLQKATDNLWIARLVSLLLCIYGADMYMFRIVTHTMTSMWGLNQYFVVGFLVAAIIYATGRGIDRVGTITSITIPAFFITFCTVGTFILIKHAALLPGILALIIKSAFTGHAALGGFAGSTVLMSMAHGMKRACYSGDIGIGYAAVINSETDEADPAKQAALGIFGTFLDTFIICTMSVLLILVTGLWHQNIHESQIVAYAIGDCISFVHILWPAFIFLLGYSNIIAIFSVGRKAAQFLFPNKGKTLYLLYGIPIFVFFSFVGTERQLLTIMSSVGILLLIINLWGILTLYKKITYSLQEPLDDEPA